MEELQCYDEIINYLHKKKRTLHLLIGNGFSVAYDKNIFSYNALSRFLMNSDNQLLKDVFKVFDTQNFELVMEQLENFVSVANILDIPQNYSDKIASVTLELKSSLINAVSEMHPEQVFNIPEENSAACASFLKEYLNQGNVFSTNYDLLLYWVMMRNGIDSTDGFGRDADNIDTKGFDEDIEWSELRWGKNKSGQNVHYLHGSLPLFDTGYDIIKEEYDGEWILDKIKARMEKGHFPIFVTAGNAAQKMKHISHNKYLTHCYDKLCNIEGSLVTFGFSFGDNDTHIIDAINRASKHGQRRSDRLYSIYIGVFSDSDLNHMKTIEKKFSCKVKYFDARTANIWGNR